MTANPNRQEPVPMTIVYLIFAMFALAMLALAGYASVQ